MDILDYLNENQKECFSMRNPILLKKGNEEYVVYLGRYPVVDLDLAIIIKSNEEIYFDIIWKNSLERYNGKPSKKMINELYGVIRKERKVLNLNELSTKISLTLQDSFC